MLAYFMCGCAPDPTTGCCTDNCCRGPYSSQQRGLRVDPISLNFPEHIAESGKFAMLGLLRMLKEQLERAGSQGREQKRLDAEVEAARAEATYQSITLREQLKEQLMQENLQFRMRLLEAGKAGRDVKQLGAEIEQARVEAAERSTMEKR
eukprot:9481963-Pyramimonas_sp.AAC.2